MEKLRLPRADLGRKPSKRELFFFVFMLIGIMILFLNWLWFPQSKSLKSLGANLKAIQMQVDAAQELINATKKRLRDMRSEMKDPDKDDAYVNKVLNRPVGNISYEVSSATDLLASHRIARKVRILKMETGKSKAEKGYTVVPILIRFSGRYAGIRDYLKALENFERPLVVKTIKVEKKGAGSNILLALIKADLYIPKGLGA